MSFLRILNINVNGLPISGMRIDFDITESNQKKTKEPNTAEIRIYNLAPITRNKISNGQFLTLNAGHIDNIPAPIFNGRIKEYKEENTTTEIISVLQVEDRGGNGENDLYKTKKSIFFPPLTTAVSICGSICGFAGTPLASAPIRDYIFIDGFSHTGLLKKALDKVVYDCLKMEWFVDSGRVFIEDENFPTISLATALSPTNGLIGSPEKFVEEEHGQKIDKYKVKCLLNPRSVVGQSLTVFSKVCPMNGVFKIENIRKYGSNYTTDFYNEYIVRAI
jgi:hypothetical protein